MYILLQHLSLTFRIPLLGVRFICETMDSMLLNSTLKPSQVDEVRWIYCHDEVIYARMDTYGLDKSGKWMMFFKKGDELDGKWKLACDLYRQGHLTGISCMKVSTNLLDPLRTTDVDNGLICFYCGPADDETVLMKYGKTLLEHISYKPKFGAYMYYKSDAQTRSGTYATGQKINSLYKIRTSDDPDDTFPAAGNASSRFTQRRNCTQEEKSWRSPVSKPEEKAEETNWRLLPRKHNFFSHQNDSNNWRQRKSDPK